MEQLTIAHQRVATGVVGEQVGLELFLKCSLILKQLPER